MQVPKYLARAIFSVTLAVVSMSSVCGQGRYGKVERLIQQLRYHTALVKLHKIPEATNTKEGQTLYGDCHWAMHRYEDAHRFYELALAWNPEDPELLYKYGMSLKTVEKHQEADQVLQHYEEVVHIDIISHDHTANLDQDMIAIEMMPFNSPYNDFSPGKVNNELVFCSSRPTVGHQPKYEWDGEAFSDLFKVLKPESGWPEYEVRSLDSRINSHWHEGPFSQHPLSNALYFTCNATNLRGDKTLQISVSSWQSDGWFHPRAFEHNVENYNTGHPTISPSGRVMFFSSDRPGGLGGADLYRCQWTPAGWGNPQNLGPLVNTENKEMFPHAVSDSLVFFSSERPTGLGGMDLYRLELRWGSPKVTHMGTPFSSSRDDFGIYVASMKPFKGYFSSNQADGLGGDDIYFFRPKTRNVHLVVMDEQTGRRVHNPVVKFLEDDHLSDKVKGSWDGELDYTTTTSHPDRVIVSSEDYVSTPFQLDVFNCDLCDDTTVVIKLGYGKDQLLMGRIKDIETGEIKPGTSMIMRDENEQVHDVVITDDDGAFEIPLDKKTYKLEVIKAGYLHEEIELPLETNDPVVYKDYFLTPKREQVALDLPNIYFPYDESYVTPAAELILLRLVKIMELNPGMQIEMASHTDERGSDQYNQQLSKRRSESVFEYLIMHGISRSRMHYEYYGESFPAKVCTPRVECDERIHHSNRRTEFRIRKY